MEYAWWYYTIDTTWLEQQLVFVWYMAMALGSWWGHIMSDNDTLFGILVDAHIGILAKAYDWYIPWMIFFWHIAWCWCTWMMYIGVVHNEHTFLYMDVVHDGHILAHDWYLDHDSLFHCCFMMVGMAWVWCMNRSKDRYMVSHWGDIPLGGVILLPMILGGDIYQMHT